MLPVCRLINDDAISIKQEMMERKGQSETFGDINHKEEEKKLEQMLKDLSKSK